MGGDAMRGREAGTLDEMRATGWVAEQAREAGLQPAGDDGTFFQWWPMRRTRLSASSEISLGGKPLQLWRDAVALSNQPVTADLPVVFVADTCGARAHRREREGGGDGRRSDPDSAGGAVHDPRQFPGDDGSDAAPARRARSRRRAAPRRSSSRTDRARSTKRSSPRPRYPRAERTRSIRQAARRARLRVRATQNQTRRRVRGPSRRRWRGRRRQGRGRGNATTIPALWVRNAALESARSPNAKLVANIVSETFYYPSGNVIGVVKGTDPRLAHEYVLYSGHQDHDGTRYVVNGDSIWNGADDNASVSVAMLAIARALRRASRAAPDSLRLARRGRARTPRLTLVRESFRPCRTRRSSRCSTAT